MLDINIYSFINSLIGACLLISLCPLLERLIIRGQISSRIYFLVFLLIFIVLLIGALSFFPALALGPLAEFFGSFV